MGLSYVIIFIVALAINFFTLWLVARKSNRGNKILFTNPAFLLGDFFLIPLYFVLNALFLNNNVSFISAIPTKNLLFILLPSLIVTMLFGKKFNLLKPIWVPHGIFYWVTVVSFLLAALVTITNDWKDSLLVVAMLILLSVHQLLRIIYPKKLENML